MEKSNIKLLYGYKQWGIFILFLLTVLFITLLNKYISYLSFIKNDLFHTQATVLNIYPKENRVVLKLQTEDFNVFTWASREDNFKQLDKISILLVTKNIGFLEYSKDFFTLSLNAYTIENPNTARRNASTFIAQQHSNVMMQELYNTLFFALPISKELRTIAADFGIAHLIAISGYHSGVIIFIVYWLLYYPYSYVHQNYFPYRNKKFDILIICIVILFAYLIFIMMVPSFLRAFVMFILGIFLLRGNINILGFENLLIATLLILAFFPQYVFSISLWFSVAGVFYIFLFLEYFKNLPKIRQILLFNVWMYLVMNPITNYFFGTTSYLQLFSSVLTFVFTLFYPLVAVLHLLGYGGLLDAYILKLFTLPSYSSEVLTPLPFFIAYIIFSFLAITKKSFFIVVNMMLVYFTLYIFYINSTHY